MINLGNLLDVAGRFGSAAAPVAAGYRQGQLVRDETERKLEAQKRAEERADEQDRRQATLDAENREKRRLDMQFLHSQRDAARRAAEEAAAEAEAMRARLEGLRERYGDRIPADLSRLGAGALRSMVEDIGDLEKDARDHSQAVELAGMRRSGGGGGDGFTPTQERNSRRGQAESEIYNLVYSGRGVSRADLRAIVGRHGGALTEAEAERYARQIAEDRLPTSAGGLPRRSRGGTGGGTAADRAMERLRGGAVTGDITFPSR